MTNRRVWVSLLLGAAVLVLAIGAYSLWVLRAEPAALPESAPPSHLPGLLRFAPGAPQLAALRVEAVAAAPVPLAEPLNGRVVYDENATARIAAPVAGRVVALPVQPNDRVRAGQVLLRLDSPDLGNAIADTQKALADARRKVLAWQRAEALYEGEVLARKDLEAARADLEQAQAESSRARLRLANLGAAKSSQGAQQYELRAPLAGIVVDRQVTFGMEVRPDLPNPLFVVSDPKRLWVLADLPEDLLSRVSVGNDVAIEVDAYPGERFAGRIERVAAGLDPATRRIPLHCTVANSDGRLKPEMYARVILLAGTGRRVRLPNSALVSGGEGTFVFVERLPGEFEKRSVKLQRQGREHAYVESGLNPGERVVVTGALLLEAEMSGAH